MSKLDELEMLAKQKRYIGGFESLKQTLEGRILFKAIEPLVDELYAFDASVLALIRLVRKQQSLLEYKDRLIIEATGYTGDADCESFLDQALSLTIDLDKELE